MSQTCVAFSDGSRLPWSGGSASLLWESAPLSSRRADLDLISKFVIRRGGRSLTPGMLEIVGLILDLVLFENAMDIEIVRRGGQLTCYCDNGPIVEWAIAYSPEVLEQAGAEHLKPLYECLQARCNRLRGNACSIIFRQPFRSRRSRGIEEADALANKAARGVISTDPLPPDLEIALGAASDIFRSSTPDQWAVRVQY